MWFTWEEKLWMAAAAIVVDLAIGDPKRLPHPVVMMGWWIRWVERRTCRYAPAGRSFLSGLFLCFSTVLLSAAAAGALVRLSLQIHPWLGYAVNVCLMSTTIAWKGLADAVMRVYRELAAGRIAEARRYTGYIVGRDTDRLEEPELSRAAVETAAENSVDALLSPVLFAILGGAPGAFLYRAANTLDSMVGYRNAKYEWYGKASARLDDVLNWVPARLAGLLFALAAALCGYSARSAVSAVRRFAKLHPSPNGGHPEAAAAGALGIRLGGVNFYGGAKSFRAYLGEAKREIEREDIRRMVKMLHVFGSLLLGGIICAAAAVTWGIG